MAQGFARGDKPSTIRDGRKVVVTAGAAVSLVASSTPCTRIHVQALASNADLVVVGGSTVVADESTRRGVALVQYASITLEIDDVQKVFVDAVTSGDGVSFVYEVA